MKLAYFDCYSGAAGDMLNAALIDAGAPFEALHAELNKLALPGVTIAHEPVKRGGIAARRFIVEVAAEGQANHRHLPQIEKILSNAGLPPRAAKNALAVFHRLAEAEAAVHQTTLAKVHFHEVGANDAIIDIVGVCVALDLLGVERVVCSPIPTGSGTVKCDHGVMPVPAPATAQLLRGVPLAACDEPGELTTPTGAALLTTLADGYGPLPDMRVSAVGYGAGTREGKTRPNFMRVLLGEAAAAVGGAEHDRVIVLETQLDDAPGQVTAFALERILAEGALDAYFTPIVMKKGRPGQLLTVLAEPAAAGRLEQVLFAETTTFGIRKYEATRSKLQREHVSVSTAFGPLRVKLGRRAGAVVQAWPEYEDCARAATAHGVALRVVQQAALDAWGRTHDRGGGERLE